MERYGRMARVFKNNQCTLGMCTPIFKKSDFLLCKVPVPEGYPQSQTHVGIGLLSSGQYVMTTSPYPSVRYRFPISFIRAAIRKLSNNRFFYHSGEFYENPCIYVNEIKNEIPPTLFKLAQPGPLMGPLPSLYGYPSFNSDPDLFIENDKVYVLNRSIYRQKGKYNFYMKLYLIEGTIENDCFIPNSMSLFREGKDIVGSQCLTNYKGNYILTDIISNSYNDGQTYRGIRYITANSLENLRLSTQWNSVKLKTEDYLPWHMSLFQHNDTLYTIIACVKKGVPQRCWQLLGKFSDDLSSLSIYKKPLTDYNSYRGAAIVLDNGDFVFYNTTVRESVKGGKSVDGREIMMARMPFAVLLDQIK